MGRHIKSTSYDTRLHQHYNSIQFGGELLTLREAADRGYLKLFTRPGYSNTSSSITSFRMTKEGIAAQERVDLSAVIDPLGTGEKMTVDEALARELIRPITGNVMIGYEVV